MLRGCVNNMVLDLDFVHAKQTYNILLYDILSHPARQRKVMKKELSTVCLPFFYRLTKLM